jgi:hypothetical protein
MANHLIEEPPIRPSIAQQSIARQSTERGATFRLEQMAKREPRMVSLGYGKFARADRIYALVPLDPKDRGEGRRTYVHVDGMAEPVVASRSERAIMADVEAALTEAAGIPRRRRRSGAKGQEKLL